MVRVNCETVVDLSGRFLPAMVERGRGAIINIASTAAFQPMPKSATYAATKAFVLSFSEALHQELKGSGVTVTAVCPGPVRTEFVDAAGLEQRRSAPGFIWMSAEDVAEDAVKAAEAGKRAVVPGGSTTRARSRPPHAAQALAAAHQADLAPGRVGGPLHVNGVELSWREHGGGPPLLCLHETAAAGAIWEPLVAALAPGCGRSPPTAAGGARPRRPEQYTATTVEEQAADADALLAELDPGPAVVCGAGLGAVVALELLLRHGDRGKAAV